MGAYSLLIALGIAIGPAAFGPAMSAGFETGYAIAAGVGLAAALAVLAMHSRVANGARGEAARAPLVVE
jgi:hypothetical protein